MTNILTHYKLKVIQHYSYVKEEIMYKIIDLTLRKKIIASKINISWFE